MTSQKSRKGAVDEAIIASSRGAVLNYQQPKKLCKQVECKVVGSTTTNGGVVEKCEVSGENSNIPATSKAETSPTATLAAAEADFHLASVTDLRNKNPAL